MDLEKLLKRPYAKWIIVAVLLFIVWLLKMLLGSPGGGHGAWAERLFKKSARRARTLRGLRC